MRPPTWRTKWDTSLGCLVSSISARTRRNRMELRRPGRITGTLSIVLRRRRSMVARAPYLRPVPVPRGFSALQAHSLPRIVGRSMQAEREIPKVPSAVGLGSIMEPFRTTSADLPLNLSRSNRDTAHSVGTSTAMDTPTCFSTVREPVRIRCFGFAEPVSFPWLAISTEMATRTSSGTATDSDSRFVPSCGEMRNCELHWCSLQ
jgi:hypothetical protein